MANNSKEKTRQLNINETTTKQWETYFKNLHEEEQDMKQIQKKYWDDDFIELTNGKIENILKYF